MQAAQAASHVPDSQNPFARAFALQRLAQAAQAGLLGHFNPNGAHDPTAVWRALSAAIMDNPQERAQFLGEQVQPHPTVPAYNHLPGASANQPAFHQPPPAPQPPAFHQPPPSPQTPSYVNAIHPQLGSNPGGPMIPAAQRPDFLALIQAAMQQQQAPGGHFIY